MDSNNSIRNATNIRLRAAGGSLRESVGGRDRADFFKFKLGKSSRVSLNLAGRSNLDMQLFGTNRRAIRTGNQRGRAEQINTVLGAGTYTLRVYAGKGTRSTTAYQLRVGLSAAPTVDATTGLAIEASTQSQYAPHQLMVQLKSGSNPNAIAQSVGAAGTTTLLADEGWHLFSFDQYADIQSIRGSLSANSGVNATELDYAFTTTAIPNDSRFNEQWSLHNTAQFVGSVNDADVDAAEAWDRQRGSRNVVVAVIDSGIDYNHPDLAANLWRNAREVAGNGIDDDRNGYIDDIRGWDFALGNNNPMDTNGHGTHVAGTIGAVGGNGLGVAGVAHSTTIMNLKHSNAQGQSLSSNTIKAIDYAIRNGAKIINASFGGTTFNTAMKDALARANNAGVVVVAAAGNSTSNNDLSARYPTNYDLPNIISVASTDMNDRLSTFSNYGLTTVDMAAPGTSILSTLPGGGYGYMNGTSMATPHVAGAAALLLSQNSALTPTQIRSILMSSGDSSTVLQGKTVSGKRLNVNNALRTIIPNTAPTVVATPMTVTRAGQPVVISATRLQATDGQESSSELIYTLTDLPNKGTLLLNGTALGMGATFTQANIDAGVVSFQPNPGGTFNHSNAEGQIAISGNEVIWKSGTGNTAEIFSYNLQTGVTTQLTNTPAEESSPVVGIDGSVAWHTVWTINNGISTTVYGDINTYTPGSGIVAITSDYNSSDDRYPTVDADYIAWSSDGEIKLKNLRTELVSRLTNDLLNDTVPQFSGNSLFWSSFQQGQSGLTINRYDLLTGQTTPIASGVSSVQGIDPTQEAVFYADANGFKLYTPMRGTETVNLNDVYRSPQLPSLQGITLNEGKLLWSAWDGSDFELYVRDVATGVTTQLTNDAIDQIGPKASNGRVIYSQGSTPPYQTYSYNLGSGEVALLTGQGYIASSNDILLSQNSWSSSGSSSSWMFVGDDSFSFNLSDGQGGTSSGSLSLSLS